MSRKLFALSIVAAAVTLGFATSEADAKSWRSRHRDHNCCYEQHHQERNCGHQRVNYRECGHHQHYQQHVAVSTCCAPVRPAALCNRHVLFPPPR